MQHFRGGEAYTRPWRGWAFMGQWIGLWSRSPPEFTSAVSPSTTLQNSRPSQATAWASFDGGGGDGGLRSGLLTKNENKNSPLFHTKSTGPLSSRLPPRERHLGTANLLTAWAAGKCPSSLHHTTRRLLCPLQVKPCQSRTRHHGATCEHLVKRRVTESVARSGDEDGQSR